MKIRITSEGVDDLAIGAELTLSNVPPPSWAGKYVIVGDDAHSDPAEIHPLNEDINTGPVIIDADEKPRRNRKDAE